jgi:hypothetical protein
MRTTIGRERPRSQNAGYVMIEGAAEVNVAVSAVVIPELFLS